MVLTAASDVLRFIAEAALHMIPLQLSFVTESCSCFNDTAMLAHRFPGSKLLQLAPSSTSGSDLKVSGVEQALVLFRPARTEGKAVHKLKDFSVFP